jgi:hypothetical protein
MVLIFFFLFIIFFFFLLFYFFFFFLLVVLFFSGGGGVAPRLGFFLGCPANGGVLGCRYSPVLRFPATLLVFFAFVFTLLCGGGGGAPPARDIELGENLGNNVDFGRLNGQGGCFSATSPREEESPNVWFGSRTTSQ